MENIMTDEHPLVLEARLLISAPEVVFRELKSRALKKRRKPYGLLDDGAQIESSLLRRQERLVHLALASFGLNDEVVAEIYKAGLTPPVDDIDARFNKGLRIACLSNRFVGEPFSPSLPFNILGTTETKRLMLEGEWDEVGALLSNPQLDADFLAGLYRKTDLFADIEQERLRRLIHSTAGNPRLAIRRDMVAGPDLAHGGAQQGIIHLLETAPVIRPWLVTLRALIASLNPMNVRKSANVGSIIDRWRLLNKDETKKERDGLWTRLSESEEFCCLIACLYYKAPQFLDNKLQAGLEVLVSGGNYEPGLVEDNQKNIYPGPKADNMVLRCAYYANAKLSEREMRTGYERDGSAFTFAMLFNRYVYRSDKIRSTFEKLYLTDELKSRFVQICEQCREQELIFKDS
jgi:hypothetical protein